MKSRINDSVKKRKHIIAVCVTLFCVLYIILALRPLGTELHLTPEWTEDVSHVQEAAADDELIPYKMGLSIGYFTPDGKVVSHIPYPVKSAISSSYYSTFGTDNTSAAFYSNSGEYLGNIEEAGFPFFDKERIFVFLAGGNSFVKCDSSGKREWIYESYAPITAFGSSRGGIVAGFADGTIASFTPDGKISQRFMPGGSNVPVILGAGISSDGNKLACVSGRDQQRFVVAEKNGEHSKIIFHEYLPKDFTRQVIVKFSLDDRTVFYNFNGGLGIVNLDTLKSSSIPLSGAISQIEESETNGLVYVLSRDGGTYTVTIIEPFDHKVAQFSFQGSAACIQVAGDAVFVGRDNKISRFTVSRR